MSCRCALAVFAFAACAGSAGNAIADSNSVALVTELSGSIKPALQVHRELAPGTRIDLGAAGRVSLLHYSSCTIVTVSGGIVTVTEGGVQAKPANIESSTPGPCPRVHRILHSGPGPLGGVVVTRGEPKPYADVAAVGEVVLSGKRAANAKSVEILDVNRNPIDRRLAVRDASFKLDGTLTAKRAYVLRVAFDDGGEPVDVQILVAPSNTANLLIVRLE